MVSLYKDPNGEKIFGKSIGMNNNQLEVTGMTEADVKLGNQKTAEGKPRKFNQVCKT